MKMDLFLACFLSFSFHAPTFCLACSIPAVQLVPWHFMVSLIYISWFLSWGILWEVFFLIPHRDNRVEVIRCSLDREGENVSQVQGQPEKSSEKIRVGRDRAKDGHSKKISGAGNVGLGWAEMESSGMDREKEDTEGGWAAKGKHVAALGAVRGSYPSFWVSSFTRYNPNYLQFLYFTQSKLSHRGPPTPKFCSNISIISVFL